MCASGALKRAWTLFAAFAGQGQRQAHRHGPVRDLPQHRPAVLPGATIVADRFHVIRLVNQHFLNAWKDVHPEGRKNRGLLSLMRRHEWRLKPEQRENLQRYLSDYPALAALYEAKQRLNDLLLLKNLRKKTAQKEAALNCWN
jgi:transposase